MPRYLEIYWNIIFKMEANKPYHVWKSYKDLLVPWI
jgi:hypothetical protein